MKAVSVSWFGTPVASAAWRSRGSFVAFRGVAEETRARGFAAPAFAGCAFVEGW
jgi:hypothetical protein